LNCKVQHMEDPLSGEEERRKAHGSGPATPDPATQFLYLARRVASEPLSFRRQQERERLYEQTRVILITIKAVNFDNISASYRNSSFDCFN
jgi:hypothetical protein